MFASVNGVELFFERHGSGQPMLVMHGGLGLDHTYFRPWLDQLGDTVELIYYDHRGNGRSSRPTTMDGITHATWADDADALRAHLAMTASSCLVTHMGAFSHRSMRCASANISTA